MRFIRTRNSEVILEQFALFSLEIEQISCFVF